jgi:hypothetical protein
MKRLFSVAVVIALLLSLAVISEASVGYKKDGAPSGNAANIDFDSTCTSFDGSTVTLYANGYKGGVTTNVSSESNLTSAALAYGFVQFVAGTAKTICIYAGTPGQMLTLLGCATTTITIDQRAYPVVAGAHTGWNSIALTNQSQSVTLLYYDDSVGWVIVGNAGATLT